MNLELLHERIKDPASIQSGELSAIRELTEKYPFAQIFSILYLKALANNQDIQLEEMIGQHAFRITDRSKLHDLLYSMHQQQTISENSPLESIVETPVLEDPIIETQIEPEITSEVKAVEVEPEVIAVEAEAPVIEELVTEVEEQENTDVETELTEKEQSAVPDGRQESEKQNEKQNENEERIPDELEKELLSHVMASAYSLELETQAKSEEQNIPEESGETAHDDIHQQRSFTSWLKAGQTHTENEQKNDPIKAKSKQLIEQFIKEEPVIGKIEPQVEKEKTEFYSAPKKAKESISDEKLIYSETLANIFVLQGNYPKAILAFEQLMLTNPEKKLYFAQKIKDLNKKLNS